MFIAFLGCKERNARGMGCTDAWDEIHEWRDRKGGIRLTMCAQTRLAAFVVAARHRQGTWTTQLEAGESNTGSHGQDPTNPLCL